MTSVPDPLVRVSTTHGVTTLTLNSPRNRNALSTALLTQLLAALAAAATDDSVRVVVLSHCGPVFSSGADLTETAAAYRDGTVPVAMLGDVLAAIWECPKPVVARIGGPARAGGLGLIAAADVAICAQDATFAFTEVRLGVIPAVISATVLPRLQPRAAAEFYLTGDTFDGRRAAEIGLVTTVTTADALDETVASYCLALVRGAPGALAGAKELLRRASAESFRAGLAELRDLSVRYFHSAEGREGVAAFGEKRPARWVPGS